MRYITILLTTILVCLTVSCEENSPATSSADPSNLTIQITTDDKNPATVNIIATADNAINYEFYMGEGSSDTPDGSSADGNFSYEYTSSGSYQIEVRAYGESGRFLRENRQLDVRTADFDEGFQSPTSYAGYTLVWSDEFNGTSLNTADWTYEIGTGNNGWGNNELQYYTANNTEVADGYLSIEARQESVGGRSYTSSRIITQDKQSFQYGRIDIRARLPERQGMWPALWMLGQNFSTAGWPFCGEIDIMEMVGGGEGKDDVVHGTVHWDNNGSYANFGGSTQLSSGKFSDKFHVFSIIWTPNAINWYLDNEFYHSIDISPASMSEFRQDYFFIFNIAVGGNWPGSPNASTRFPQRMYVDYVRVFQTD